MAALADPVEFDVGSFSYDTTGLVFGTPDLSVTITPASTGLAFPIFLSVGETSPVFDVLNVSVTGFAGVIAGLLESTINFVLPSVGSVSGTGFGAGGLFFFTGAGGVAIFDQPDLINFAGGVYQVHFYGFEDLDFQHFGGINGNITADITLVSTSIPEPGTLSLIAFGLLGLTLLRRMQHRPSNRREQLS